MENLFHIADLITRKNKGIITSSELSELEEWANEKDENLALLEKATNDQILLDKLEVYQLFKSSEVWQSIDSTLFETKTIPFFPQKFMRYAAVLIPFLIIAGVSWYYSSQSETLELISIDNTIKPG